MEDFTFNFADNADLFKEGGSFSVNWTDITIGEKKYKVECVESEEDKKKGLQNVISIASDEGMLFIYDKPQTVRFHMKNMNFPIDMVFIDENNEVISVYEAEQQGKFFIEEDNVSYVLEVNINSGIQEGDYFDYDEDPPTMKALSPDGSVQMKISGGERIYSRKNTKTLIKMAKRAEKTKSDTDYKRLGNKMFSYIKQQEEREPEYVQTPESK